jgi:hypothetical protein
MSSAGEPGEVFHPQIRETRGPVMVKGAKYSIWEPAEEGMLLLTGDVLRTEKGGFARIEFASGIIELYETTVLIIPSIDVVAEKKDIREVIIEEGKTLFDINHTGVENGFQFRTKNVQGGVKGTLFTVSYLNDGTAVNVYRGEVLVSDLDGTPGTMTSLAKGKALRVEGDSGFGNTRGFDPDFALEDYKYNIPPGLDEKGLPADYNANPRNKGIRNRGTGKSGSSSDGSSVYDQGNNDQGDDDKGGNDQGDNDQGEDEQ